MDNDIARCVGLWLAEGDSKSKREITFTNNCFDLVDLFSTTIEDLFEDLNPRLYVYRPNKDAGYRTLDSAKVNFYRDSRASKPYYILRYASTEKTAEWKEKVEYGKKNPDNFQEILQGFFAGEGSVSESTRNSRKLKISQGQRNRFLERIFEYFGIEFNFRSSNRSYVIKRRENLEKLYELDIAVLHPRKRRKFEEILSSFTETHYQKGYLKKKVYERLSDPFRTKELADMFDRSPDRLCDVLMKLKEEDKVQNYKAGRFSYWIREDQDIVIISDVKKDYLDLLKENPLKVGKVADHLEVP
ncbi:MAG: hypothetical protein ABEJ03_02130 [Candidatus Nanohaloarchaea archaeon]